MLLADLEFTCVRAWNLISYLHKSRSFLAPLLPALRVKDRMAGYLINHK